MQPGEGRLVAWAFLYLFAVWAAIVLVLFLARPRSGGEDPP